jgi:serine/threonine protein kinase
MDHPFLIKTYDLFQDDFNHYLVMEYAPGGSLQDFIAINGPLPEDRACDLFVQVIAALDYLHNSSCVAHHDLSAQNILLDTFQNLRLIDFGLESNVKSTRTLNGYSAPEVIAGKKHSFASDIWSAGSVLFLMITGESPTPELFDRFLSEPPLFEIPVSDHCIDLLRRMLERDKENRIAIQQIKLHPWVSLAYQKINEVNDLRSVDTQVLGRMSQLGYTTSDVRHEDTAIYRIVKREMVSAIVSSVMKAFVEQPPQRIRRATDSEITPPPLRTSQRIARVSAPPAPAPIRCMACLGDLERLKGDAAQKTATRPTGLSPRRLHGTASDPQQRQRRPGG